jgi:glycosyltransferase involved in cell wall biosynthesis
MHKYLETPLHSLASFLDVLFRPSAHQFQAILLCNAANSPFAWLASLRGVPLAINVDGIERRRSKWNALGRLWYLIGERTSVWFAKRVVADAEVIAEYYRERYRIEPAVIAYGATPVVRPPGPMLEEFGLKPGKFLLYVSRLEPENNALGVVKAYAMLPEAARTMPLVIVGDAPYADAYKAELRAHAVSGVHFTGFRFGEAYQELRSHCAVAIQATEVGGTHPALVESMAYGNAIIANDVPEHREVLGDAGIYYPRNDFAALSKCMAELMHDTVRAHALGQAAKERARVHYCWDRITDQYEEMLKELLTSD